MKRIVVILSACLLIALAGNGQGKKFQDIIGRWDIAGEQNAGAYLEVIDSTTIILTYMGETRRITNIKMDLTKSPYWFDFSTQDTSRSVLKVKSLMEIVGDSVMKWQLFIDEDRPPYFTSSKGELLYLKRSKATTVPTASND